MNQVERTLTTLSRRMGNVERMTRVISNQDVWLTKEQVEEQFGYGSKTLQRMRKNGTLNSKQFRCAITGRKYQYLKSAIEALFQ